MGISPGLFGKHPAFGDFLDHGLPAPVPQRLGAWLDPALTALRAEMGEGWQGFWDSAQGLRFWTGAAVLGTPVAGILRPSRDKVGRRYPLIVAVAGAQVLPPVIDPDQTLYETLEAHLETASPSDGAASLLRGLALDLPVAEAEPQAAIWAHRPDADLAALLDSALSVDHLRASLDRAHVWAPGGADRAALWHGGHGLPQAAALGWLLGGVARETRAGRPANAEGEPVTDGAD